MMEDHIQKTSSYHFVSDSFEGPLETLLQLIEERKLEISTVSLGMVTQDFLKHLDRVREAFALKNSESGATKEFHGVGLDVLVLVDFVSIASRLILIKSKSLIPDLVLSTQEEDQIGQLEERLRLYQKIKPGIRAFAKAYANASHSFARPYMKNMALSAPGMLEGKIFYPGTTTTVGTLTQRLEELFSYLKKTEYEVRRVHEKIVSLEEHIRTVSTRIQNIEQSSLAKLTTASNKTELVLTFLAILHLARDQIITLEQSMHFSDIIISRHNGDKPPM